MLSLKKLRSAQTELAVCILGPLLVLAVVTIPGRVYCRHLQRDLSTKEALLARLPGVEKQVAEAKKELGPFVANADDDKASQLTLAVGQAAQTQGFVTRSVNVEKQAGPESETWSDYRVTLGGEGVLRSVIAMLDSLENPSRHFRVAQVTLRTTGVDPETMYAGEVVLMSRSVSPTAQAGVALPAQGAIQAHFDEMGGRLDALVSSIRAGSDKRAPLILRGMECRNALAAVEAAQEVPLSLKLNGVVKDVQHPLALTDRGVLTVGDEVDGFKVTAIAKDRVELVNKQGQRSTVTLYGD